MDPMEEKVGRHLSRFTHEVSICIFLPTFQQHTHPCPTRNGADELREELIGGTHRILGIVSELIEHEAHLRLGIGQKLLGQHEMGQLPLRKIRHGDESRDLRPPQGRFHIETAFPNEFEKFPKGPGDAPRAYEEVDLDASEEAVIGPRTRAEQHELPIDKEELSMESHLGIVPADLDSPLHKVCEGRLCLRRGLFPALEENPHRNTSCPHGCQSRCQLIRGAIPRIAAAVGEHHEDLLTGALDHPQCPLEVARVLRSG